MGVLFLYKGYNPTCTDKEIDLREEHLEIKGESTITERENFEERQKENWQLEVAKWIEPWNKSLDRFAKFTNNAIYKVFPFFNPWSMADALSDRF